MKKTIITMLVLLGLTRFAFACEETSHWTMEAAFGMAHYANVDANDGQTAVGRLSMGYANPVLPYGQISVEVGIQSGNSMRLVLPKESIYELGGIPIDATMKPMLDILAGFKTEPLADLPFSVWGKGGIAYRSMRLDRESVPGLKGFSPEFQTGISYAINEKTGINIGYQYISGNKPELTVNPLTETGILCNMPSAQALLLGFSYQF